MAGLIGEGVSLRGLYDEKWAFPFTLTGAVVRGDVFKLVSQDTATKNAAKLAVADEKPLGVLGSFEDRTGEGIKIGTVYLKGSFQIPTTGVVALGASIVGSATPGVAKAAAAGSNNTIVVEVDAVNNTAVVIFA